jgi:hypothetical protein
VLIDRPRQLFDLWRIDILPRDVLRSRSNDRPHEQPPGQP